MAAKSTIHIAVDPGTSYTRVVAAEAVDDELRIIGVGEATSQGVRSGVVNNVKATTRSIAAAVADAEIMSGVSIRGVHLGVSGGYLRGMNRHGMVNIAKGPVTAEHASQVRRVACAIPFGQDERLVAAINQSYFLDHATHVPEPVGLRARRLDGFFHVVTANTRSTQNLIRCCSRHGLAVEDLHLHQLAAAEAVLTREERELNVCVVDVGGGTTDIAVYIDGVLRHTAVLRQGGIHLTSDLAHGLKAPLAEAERIKLKYGCVHPGLVKEEETFEVSGLGGRPPRVLPREQLVQHLEPWTHRLLTQIQEEIETVCPLDSLGSGIVFTGGSASLEGLSPLASEFLGVPTRVGMPQGLGGLSATVRRPSFAAPVGLVMMAACGGQGPRSGQRLSAAARTVQRFFQWIGEVVS